MFLNSGFIAWFYDPCGSQGGIVMHRPLLGQFIKSWFVAIALNHVLPHIITQYALCNAFKIPKSP